MNRITRARALMKITPARFKTLKRKSKSISVHKHDHDGIASILARYIKSGIVIIGVTLSAFGAGFLIN